MQLEELGMLANKEADFPALTPKPFVSCCAAGGAGHLGRQGRPGRAAANLHAAGSRQAHRVPGDHPVHRLHAAAGRPGRQGRHRISGAASVLPGAGVRRFRQGKAHAPLPDLGFTA